MLCLWVAGVRVWARSREASFGKSAVGPDLAMVTFPNVSAAFAEARQFVGLAIRTPGFRNGLQIRTAGLGSEIGFCVCGCSFKRLTFDFQFRSAVLVSAWARASSTFSSASYSGCAEAGGAGLGLQAESMKSDEQEIGKS